MNGPRNARPLPQLTTAKPRIDGERCLLAQTAVSKCRACADVCPAAALIASDDALGLDEAACTGCGLCVPACPEEAVTLPRPAIRHGDRAGEIVFLACQPAATAQHLPQGVAVAPCLHAFGLRDLAAWRKAGAARIVALHGECDACAYGKSERIQTRAALFARMLASRGLPRLAYAAVAGAEWRLLLATTEPAPPPGAMSRRGLLSMFSPPAEARPPDAQHFDFLGLAAKGEAVIVAFAPRIESLACSGCDACTRICPHGAIAVQGDSYAIEPARCTNCRLCVDICAEGAVEIKAEGPGCAMVVALSSHRCTRCGAPFHQPIVEEPETRLCPICRRVNHHRNLHQVLT